MNYEKLCPSCGDMFLSEITSKRSSTSGVNWIETYSKCNKCKWEQINILHITQK